MTKPRVAVVSLGGTISMAKKVASGVVPNLDAESLVSSLPELRDIAEIKTIPFRMVASSGLSLADLLALRQDIDDLLQNEVDAVVVTQGTDTILGNPSNRTKGERTESSWIGCVRLLNVS